MLFVINTMAPVLLIIALGFFMYRCHFLSPAAFNDLNRLVYWFGIPALLFNEIAKADLDFLAVGRLTAVVLIATSAIICSGYLLGWRLVGPSRAAFVQASFRGNLAFIALPLVIYAFAEQSAAHAAETAALAVLGPMLVFYNIIAALILQLGANHGRISFALANKIGRGVIQNPMLIGCVLGVLFAAFHWPLPLVFQRTLGAIGQMALPLALLGIGASLATVKLRGALGYPLIAALLKTACLPLIGYGLGQWFALSADSLRIGLLLLATPTAAVAFVQARQMGCDEQLTATAIVISSLLAVPALATVLFIT